MNRIETAFEALLGQLPEGHYHMDALLRGAEFFEIEALELEKAAGELRLNHDLGYEGVRRLLALCIEEFEDIFTDDGRVLCEITVPAPLCALYALHSAAGDKIRFASSAFFAQIALRGIFLHREPLDPGSCAKRRCGLNKMRQLLMSRPPVKAYGYQLQFGVLCDECVKMGDGSCGGAESISVSFPRGSWDRKLLEAGAEYFWLNCQERLGIKAESQHIRRAFALYARLMKAQNRLAELNRRPERRPLMGNSLALAQSVQLMSTPRAEKFIEAMELLCLELEKTPEDTASTRYYAFYVPFMQPEVDRRFRENGVYLVGGAAFLEGQRHLGLSIPGSIAAWLMSMSIRCGAVEQCRYIAEDMARYGCSTYLTGSFAFDRWLGSATPLQAKLLAEQGIRTRTLETDFWCENVMFGSVLSRIDHICQKD